MWDRFHHEKIPYAKPYLKLNVAEDRLKMREGVIVQAYNIFRGPGVEYNYLTTWRTNSNLCSVFLICLYKSEYRSAR